MKKVLMLAVAGLLSAGIVGCHASADVDSPDNTSGSTYKKTTVKHDDDGTKTTKTEVKRETSY